MRKISRFTTIITLLLASLLFVFSGAVAGGIKDRMKARIPLIKELKAKGIVGENNKGFLEQRVSSDSSTSLVSKENIDRKKVYSAIAKKQGAQADFVGQRRASQIAAKSNPGEWLQRDSGEWYQK